MSAFLHPDAIAVRRALEQHLPVDMWARLTESEVQTMITLIQRRCRKVAADAMEEFAALDRSPATEGEEAS